jgi:hypothetical protein
MLLKTIAENGSSIVTNPHRTEGQLVYVLLARALDYREQVKQANKAAKKKMR